MAVEVRHAADRAEALIEALLTLARSDRGAGPAEPLDVAVLAEDAGLGLSIVRSVATAHRGQVTARPRPGGGLEVSVLLPACPG
jgi:signal transduction histidine kinase